MTNEYTTREAVAYLARHGIKMTERRLRAISQNSKMYFGGTWIYCQRKLVAHKQGQQWRFKQSNLETYIRANRKPWWRRLLGLFTA